MQPVYFHEPTFQKRPENDNREAQISANATRMTPTKPQQETFGQRWKAVQLSKTAIFWTCLAVIAGTMLVGFT